MIVCTKSQLGWLNLPHLAILPPSYTAKEGVSVVFTVTNFAYGKILGAWRILLTLSCYRHYTSYSVLWRRQNVYIGFLVFAERHLTHQYAADPNNHQRRTVTDRDLTCPCVCACVCVCEMCTCCELIVRQLQLLMLCRSRRMQSVHLSPATRVRWRRTGTNVSTVRKRHQR